MSCSALRRRTRANMRTMYNYTEHIVKVKKKQNKTRLKPNKEHIVRKSTTNICCWDIYRYGCRREILFVINYNNECCSCTHEINTHLDDRGVFTPKKKTFCDDANSVWLFAHFLHNRFLVMRHLKRWQIVQCSLLFRNKCKNIFNHHKHL